jgi:hypothetical protein
MRAISISLSITLAAHAALAQPLPAVPAPDPATGSQPREAPPSPPPQPGNGLGSPRMPLSERMIQFRSDGLVQRGALVVPVNDLAMLVGDSPDALRLARSADEHLRVGDVLGWSSLAALGLGLVLIPAGVGLASRPESSSRDAGAAFATAGVVMVLGWIGLGLAGVAAKLDGRKDWFDAVNTYNRQLADGQIHP